MPVSMVHDKDSRSIRLILAAAHQYNIVNPCTEKEWIKFELMSTYIIKWDYIVGCSHLPFEVSRPCSST